MALRNIRIYGDELLTKTAKAVTEITPKIEILVQDMLDTMYEAQGVGLAAPQVGVLKRIVVIDVSPEADSPIILINPEIVETAEEQTGDEACLSVPGKSGTVTRPNYVKVKAFDLSMKECFYEGRELLARAMCHEIDHLDGVLYVTRVEGELRDNQKEEDAE